MTHQQSLQPGALMPATKTAPTWLYDSDHDGDVEDGDDDSREALGWNMNHGSPPRHEASRSGRKIQWKKSESPVDVRWFIMVYHGVSRSSHF